MPDLRDGKESFVPTSIHKPFFENMSSLIGTRCSRRTALVSVDERGPIKLVDKLFKNCIYVLM